MQVRNSLRAVVAASLALAALIAASGTGSASGSWTISPVVSGLNGPRGLAFDSGGNLYVAEAGKYFNIAPGPFGISHTGAVDKYALTRSGAKLRWSTALDSLFDNQHGGPEVLGPAGVSVSCPPGGHDGESGGEGCQVRVIVDESRDGVHAVTPGLEFTQIGHLLKLSPETGKPEDKSDVGDQQYAWANDHKNLWIEFPDSNPYGVLLTRDKKTGHLRTFVVDAGANTVSELMRDGTTHVIAFIPNDPVRDSTPTCAAQGPDGALYIGTLDLVANLFVFGPGQSHVYRVDPDTKESYLTAAHVWASGLTTVVSCTFDRNGTFWAAEMFQPNEAGPPGDLVAIPFENPGAKQHVGGGALPLPGGVAQGPDGALYVTLNSPNTAPRSGAVVRVAKA